MTKSEKSSPRTVRAKALLYECLVELEYVQSVENCTSGLCASAKGRDLIERGMKLLNVKDLSAEEWKEPVIMRKCGICGQPFPDNEKGDGFCVECVLS